MHSVVLFLLSTCWLSLAALQTDPIEYVEDICENMQLFPTEDYLTGDQLMFEFKPEVCAYHCLTVFDALCPQGLFLTRGFKSFQAVWISAAVWYWERRQSFCI